MTGWVCTAYAFGAKKGGKRGRGTTAARARTAAIGAFRKAYGTEPHRVSEPRRCKPAAKADRLVAIESQLARIEATLERLVRIADPTGAGGR